MFFPIETTSELRRLRQLLSPFLKSIQKCFTNKQLTIEERRAIYDEIINTASSTLDPLLINSLARFSNPANPDTVSMEHQAFRRINLRYKTYLVSVWNFSSFQHHDLFKRTIHLTQSYRRENPKISDRMRSQGKSLNYLSKNSNSKSAQKVTSACLISFLLLKHQNLLACHAI